MEQIYLLLQQQWQLTLLMMHSWLQKRLQQQQMLRQMILHCM